MTEQSPHIVFVKTSTIEKITHYQMIADAQHLPIIFADIRDIAGTQHATDELEGSVEGNANAKFKEFGNIPAHMKKQGDPMHDNIVALCKKYGMDFDPSHIHVAVDDFEWGLEPMGDKSLAETDGFKKYVDQDTLERGTKSALFPGPELAPFMSAMSGNATLLRGLQTGINELLGPDVQTVPSGVSVVFQYQTLDNLVREPQQLNAKANLIFDAQKTIKDTHTVKDLSTTAEGISATNPEFFLDKHPRTDVVMEFARQHGIAPDKSWKRKIISEEPFSTHNIMPTGDRVLASDARKESFLNRVRSANRHGDGTNIIDFAAQMSDNLRKADEILEQSDALVFIPTFGLANPPESPTLDIKAIARQFMLSSCVVAKQLNLRDAYKPFIVLNHKDEDGKGSYDKDFEIFDYLAQNGMMKDYTLGLEAIKPEGIETDAVSHRKSLYFDLLEGSDMGQLHEAKEKLLKHYQDTYYHPPALTTQDYSDLGGKHEFTDAVAKGEGIFKVGVFLSASSENLQLNTDTKAFGKWLAENEFGLVFGGGDRYLMGSLHDGYSYDYFETQVGKLCEFIASDSISDLQKKDLFSNINQLLDNALVPPVSPENIDTIKISLAEEIEKKHKKEEKKFYEDLAKRKKEDPGTPDEKMPEKLDWFLDELKRGINNDHPLKNYQTSKYKDRNLEEKPYFMAGFSTPEIVKSETKLGVLPKNMDVAILNKDIYERMAQMIALTDDAIIIRSGGAGTVQELAAVLLMKEVYKDVPEIARKKIIIHNQPLIDGQDPFYDPVLERLFGDKYQTLKRESQIDGKRTLSDTLGIYIANDDEQVKSLLTDIKGKWQQRSLTASGGAELVAHAARR